jgi:hypothetical protein
MKYSIYLEAYLPETGEWFQAYRSYGKTFKEVYKDLVETVMFWIPDNVMESTYNVEKIKKFSISIYAEGDNIGRECLLKVSFDIENFKLMQEGCIKIQEHLLSDYLKIHQNEEDEI